MTIDERVEALIMGLELEHHEGQELRKRIEELQRVVEVDAENIRALARIAESHDRRIEQLNRSR